MRTALNTSKYESVSSPITKIDQQQYRRNAHVGIDVESNSLIDDINHGDFDFIKKHINFTAGTILNDTI